MARPLRIQYPGAVYHVMNRGGSRHKIFIEKQDYEAFLKTIGEIHERWGVELFAYCLMGNHYHICLRTPEGNLSRVMRHLDGLYTQRFNRIHRRDGALLRGRYRAIVVDEDAYLAQVVRYIHLNPLAAGLVGEPQGYGWSSHRFYLRPKEAPKWLQIAKEGVKSFVDSPASSHGREFGNLCFIGATHMREGSNKNYKLATKDLTPPGPPCRAGYWQRYAGIRGTVYSNREIACESCKLWRHGKDCPSGRSRFSASRRASRRAPDGCFLLR
ncbi:MAG: transposase [Deltaproteobacteria bacterium]|nr:transposase [Deltaproteobacteria bacterium]